MINWFNILLTYRKTWLDDIPRTVFSSIDKAVYNLISSVYGLIEDLAHVKIFQEGVIEEFYGKVYALLAIFMIFKVTFSIISYVLDPTKTSDSKLGAGKMITNVMIMFVMILSAPVAFKYLYKLQDAILEENVIYNFLFQRSDELIQVGGARQLKVGNEDSCAEWRNNPNDYGSRSDVINDEVGYWTVANDGDYMALMIYRSFFNLGTLRRGQELGGASGDDADNSYIYLCNGRSRTVYGYSDVSDLINMINDTVNKKGLKNDYYVIDYQYFVGTAIGAFVLLMLISIAFDVAVRSVKLGFLQLIAPIPIISYIDPKSSKGGMFERWLKEVGKTWASLFIRLFSTFFAVFVIINIDTKLYENITTENYTRQSHPFFIMMFVIIGALMFAKQLPSLIESLFPGMKMGKMELNPFKKVANEALGGKQLLGAGGAAIGLGVGTVSRIGNLAKGTIDKLKKNNTLEKRNQRRLDRINNRANNQIDRYDNRMEKYRNKLNGLDGDSKKYARYAKKYSNAYDKSEKSLDKNLKKYSKAEEKNARKVNDRAEMDAMKNRINDFFENHKVGKGMVEAKNVVIKAGSIISQAMTAAGIGYKEASNLKFSVQKIGHESARIRNYKDEYGVADRIKDKATDFFGIRGTSGTSSEVANRITELTKDLNRINQSIRVMSNSLAEEINKIGSGAQNMVSFDSSSGRPVVNTAYTPSTAREQSIYNNITYFANQLNAAYDNQAAKEKELKKQEKIKSMPGDLKR